MNEPCDFHRACVFVISFAKMCIMHFYVTGSSMLCYTCDIYVASM